MLAIFLLGLLYTFFNHHIEELIISQTNPPTVNEIIKSQDYYITPLINNTYYPVLKNELAKANNSIEVIMYILNYRENVENCQVKQLLDLLIEKHREGIYVSAILSKESIGDGDLETANMRAKNYLKENGVNVLINYGPSDIHSKIVVIDDKTVFIGAHNWTYAALFINHEVSFMIKAEEKIPEVTEYIKRLVEESIQSQEKKKESESRRRR